MDATCARDGQYVMGTVFQITACGSGDLARRSQEIFDVARRLDELFTTYAKDSAVLRLNAAAGKGAQPVPPELRRILEQSVRYGRLTHGAFDVTVGPLVALWHEAAEKRHPPTADELREALQEVGSDKLDLEPDGRVGLARRGMSVDLGGIGKGFALDRILEEGALADVDAALLDFGGSSWLARGAPPDAQAWRLMIEGPDGAPLGIVSLRDRALSVSASYAGGEDPASQVYAHIVDPATGRPVDHDRMAWVVAPNATLAEVLSKALIIRGAEGVATLRELAGVEALLAEAGGTTWRTPGFDRAVDFEPVEKTQRAPAS